ncbi:MAG: MBG domain-containing protein, partial [Thermoguttaceae bacterium]
SDNPTVFASSQSLAPLDVVVTAATLTVTVNPKITVYGSKVPALAPKITGFINGDTVAVFTSLPVESTPATPASPVGVYPINVTGGVAPGYVINDVNSTLSVIAAPLTIAAANQTMLAGSPLPPLTAGYAGFVNTDTPASLAALPKLSTTATAASPPGVYPILVSGAAAANYQITYVAGTLTILSASQTATLIPDPLLPGKSTLVIRGTAGDDVIDIRPAGTNQVLVKILGPTPYQNTFATTQIAHLAVFGGAGNDGLWIEHGVTIPALLFGGDGNNTLIGGSGPCVLVGGSGSNTLRAGSGPSILIGGSGAATLYGGSSDNILIGGSTDFDSDLQALDSILAEWGDATTGFHGRIGRLQGPKAGLNGTYFLNTATVHAGAATDNISGGAGAAWFLVSQAQLAGHVSHVLALDTTTLITGPLVALGGPSAFATRTGPITYSVTYGNFQTSTLSARDITLNRTGTAAGTVSVSGSGANYTVTVNGITGNGTLGISIAAGTAVDASGNPTPAVGPSNTFIVDTVAPTIAVSAPSTALTTGGPVTYTVTYADANFNAATLAVGNITLNATGTANGTLSVSGSGLTRTVTISSITGDGSLGISVAAGTASDLAGNLAPAAGPSATFVVDNTAPTIAVSAPSAAYATGGPITYTVTYSDANFKASSLVAGNITLNQTGTANGTLSVAGSGKSYTVTISGISGDGTLGISIAAGTASDLAGNLAPASAPSANCIVDNTPPQIFVSSPSNSYSSGGPIGFTVTYSDDNLNAVTLGAGNVTLNHTGTANGTLSVTGSGTTYLVTVSNITGNGTLGIAIAAGTASDLAGNLAPAAGPSTTCVVDNIAPTISISDPSDTLTNSGPIAYTVTYADANFAYSTLNAGNVILNSTGTATGGIGVFSTGTGTPNIFTVVIDNISGDGTLGISIPAGTASDLAGNLAPAAGPSTTFVVKNTGPVTSISAPSAASTISGPITYTVTYVDAYFGSSSLTVGNIALNATGTAHGTISVLGSGESYTVTISNITGSGTLGISIAAGTAVDTLGNPSLASGPSSIFTVV